ncbi:ribosome assembly RNA-binding protein YhbY [Orenia marismortui]|uniref:RNA-binding protein n=1 Tax=Orenia marismortui TaxID=46469 RepID=A0A4R8GSR3_9FIRM|nr:ribosome assembly RNA-binding protein YhbY [Orenia marismortui]TDX48998.1 RNA-binding protein [Orenia marismortui]
MLKGKQRSYLKSKAHNMSPLFQIGKDGISENVIAQVDEALEARELIKLKALNNSLYTAKEAANELAEACNAEFVQAIGNVFVLYRENKDIKRYNLPK